MSSNLRRLHGNAVEAWEDLVVSILAVNKYSLEKTFALLPLLRKTGIVNPTNLMSWGTEEVIAQLKSAGYDRGTFMTELFAKRLVFLGVELKSTGIASWAEVILSNDSDAIRNLLLPVKGIGPKVLRNFFLLRGIKGME